MDKIYYISAGHKDGLGGNYRHLIKSQIYAINSNYEFINFLNPLITHSRPLYKSVPIFNNCIKIRDIPNNSNVIIYGDSSRHDIINEIKKEFAYKNFNFILYDNLDLYKHINLIPFSQKLREKHQEIFHKRKDYSLNLCSPDKINICVHVRRGDVLRRIQDLSRPDYIKRFTSDETYIKYLKKIINIIPKNYQIFLFSEGNYKEFENFKKKFPNILLFIDKESFRYLIDDEKYDDIEYSLALENLKKFIITASSSDIFLGAKSHLSGLIAYLNKNLSFFEGFLSDNLCNLKNIHKFEDIHLILSKWRKFKK